MTAELFQNLITNFSTTISTQSQQSSVQTQGAQLDEQFTKAFDNAKSKYMSKETTDTSANNSRQQTMDNRTEKDYSETTDNSSKNYKTNNNEELSDVKNINSNEITQIETSEKDNAADNKSENSLNEMYNSILSEIITVSTSDETLANTEELATVSDETYTEDELNNTLKNQLNTQKNTSEFVELTTTPEDQLETSNFTTQNYSAIKTEESRTLPTQTQLTQTTQTDAIDAVETIDTETLENDLLVKTDETIADAGDEFITKSKSTTNTSISQETIDNLDITVQSVESNETSNSANKNNQQFTNQHNNAQEDVIKMSIEGLEAETENFTIPETNVETIDTISTGKVNTSQITPDKTSTLANTAPAQTKNATNTDILNQITGKITLPQDGASSKVNIILQPENLGKVTVEILQTKDGVAAKMIAETPQVKELLDKSIETLKNSIASQGVNVNNILVKVEESASAQDANLGFEQEQFNRETAKQSNNGNHSNQSENETNKIENQQGDNITPQEEDSDISSSTPTQKDTLNHNGSINITV